MWKKFKDEFMKDSIMNLFKEGQTVAMYEWDTNMFYEGVVDDINIVDNEVSMMVDDIIYRFDDYDICSGYVQVQNSFNVNPTFIFYDETELKKFADEEIDRLMNASEENKEFIHRFIK